jgi:hypothetical protein
VQLLTCGIVALLLQRFAALAGEFARREPHACIAPTQGTLKAMAGTRANDLGPTDDSFTLVAGRFYDAITAPAP